MRDCWRACRTESGSTSTRLVTSKIVYGSGPGVFGPACTRCSRSTRMQRRCVDQGSGREFDGVLGCDYFSAYRRICASSTCRSSSAWPTDPRREVPHDAAGRRIECMGPGSARHCGSSLGDPPPGLLTAERFQTQLEAARVNVLRCGTQNVPATNHCRNLAKLFEEHGESYFRFITTPEWSRPTIWQSKRSGSW